MTATITDYQRFATFFDDEIKDPVRQQLVGRQLFEKQRILGPEVYRVNYSKIVEMGAANAGRTINGIGYGKDNVRIDASEVDMITLWKEFEIPKADFDTFMKNGVNLSTVAAQSAAQVVGELEDDILLQGWNPDGSTYFESGLYQVAGNSYSTEAHWSTYGKAISSVSGALALIRADNINGVNFNLTVNPAEYSTLEASLSSYGLREWDQVMAILNGLPNAPKGEIRWSNDITAATGLITPVDPSGKYMDLMIGANYITDVYASNNSQFSPISGIIVSSLYPRVAYPNAICTLTNIA